MKIKYRLAFLLLLHCGMCGAQYIFSNLQKKDGLNVNEVKCSFQDNEGFMWFGTAKGLSRYDGSGFKHYSNFIKNNIAYSNTAVLAIAGHNNSQFWTGTNNGLFLYDKAVDTFRAIPFINEKQKNLNGVFITKLLVDNRQRVWIVTHQGLFLIVNDKAITVSAKYPTASSLSNTAVDENVSSIDNLRDGIWTASQKGLYFIDFKSGKTFSRDYNPERKAIFNEANIFSLALSKKGEMWLSCEKRLLSKYDYRGDTFTEIINHAIPKSYGLYIDCKDRVWLRNFSGKINVLEPGGGYFSFPGDSPDSYECSNVFFNNIFEDKESNLWISGLYGVSKLRGNNHLDDIITLPGNLYDDHKVDYQINSIGMAGNGNLWVCKDDGLYFVDPRTVTYKRYGFATTNMKPNRFFAAQFIKGEYWFGTGDGIKIFNPQTNRFRNFAYYAKGHDVKNISCSWIREDKQGMVWFAMWSNAVYCFNPYTRVTKRVEQIRCTEIPNPILTNSLCFFESEDGKLWFGNGTNGVIIYDGKTGIFKKINFLAGISVNKICSDGYRNVWLATTHHGLLKLDQDGHLLDSLTVKDGLSLSTVYELGFDENGRMWIGSEEGVQYMNKNSAIVSKLDVDMGKAPNDINGPLLLYNNKLYGASVNRIAVVDINRIDKISKSSPPMISAISVFEKNVPFSSTSPLLTLNYDENFFVIEFSSLNHTENQSLQYAYKLSGFDKDWVYCKRRQLAAFTNVPDGNYTFLVKCTDKNGDWQEQSTSIEIVIKPPLWKSWWFIYSLGLIAVFILWTGWKSYARKNQKKYIEETIQYFANSSYGQNSVNEICWDIARNCISQLKFEDCVVYLFDKEKNCLVQKAAFGPKNPRGQEILSPIEIEPGKGISGTVASTGKALLINDTSKDKRYIVDDKIRFSELAVPILHDNKVIGVIDSEHTARNFFTSEHLKALTTIAAISANKIAEATAEMLAKENEIKVLEINKMLAESQLMALRAQMNPHFVFNCLNSIQECIVTQKYGEASKYLNKFSKLFRMILNNSAKKMVTIYEEKNVLELYLELEQMRFEQIFEYTILVDDELDANEVLIPSMLIQPYVENALWHGLMSKIGERKLSIEFKMLSEDVFECVIDDTGVGRKKSYQIKAERGNPTRHESKGLSICKDRLDILQRQGYHTALQIIDKEDEKGNATGTKVIIELSTNLVN